MDKMLMMPLRLSSPLKKRNPRRVRHTGCIEFGQYYDEFDLTLLNNVKNRLIGKYTAILAILIVGSFIVPMAQYFWYVKDDDSSEKFFAEDVPEPPKKKGWF